MEQAGVFPHIKLVLSDIDGTLLPFGFKRISRRSIDAIHALQARGVHFGPSTGRELEDLIKFFWDDARCVDTGISANGKMVHVDGELIYRRPLPHEVLVRLVDFIRPIEGVVMNFYTPLTAELLSEQPLGKSSLGATTLPAQPLDAQPQGERAPRELVFGAIGKDEAGLELISRSLGLPFLGGVFEELPEELTTCGLILSLDVVNPLPLQAELTERFPEFDFLLSAPYVFDVVEKGWTKASKLSLLLDALGVSPEEVLYFGDSVNDLTMLKQLPNSCCMANGADEAKVAATWVIDSCENDGVAKVLEALLAYDLRLEADIFGA